ncbi:SWI/SNF-related matrix-associated actin-dependent regulator of chromatin subfamily A-like protein 1 [Homarus americanus]|uniref:SWI/SNF-related matrix-associated actin-dependent regulator of chromatin subfamily A-like protein 1 n=1 Tax=Homarus americanus TaxID=6706 RepID=UPI001C438154|nr:SWI/SNF-related matrix-associated actin-dependent regulator of chromatin subfamily A-like protein 1 [Homarus americanus]
MASRDQQLRGERGDKKKQFTDAEKIIVPALYITSEDVLGQSAKAKMENIPLSTSTVERRSRLLSEDLLDQVVKKLRTSPCFGVSRNGRCMIADDMGLGKTIQALGVAVYYRTEWPLLVVTPSSVRYSWVNAIERWVPSVSREDITVIGSGQDTLSDAQVVIITYDLLVRKLKEVMNSRFQVVIMDESHMLKNFKTARYKAAAPVVKQAKRVLMLTGTPALSRPSELYTQIAGLCPGLFPSFQKFGVRYCNGQQLPWGWNFSGSSNLQELQIMLRNIMIRRLKVQVLDQLPSKLRMMVTLDPTSIENGTKSLADAAKKFNLKSINGLEKQGALFAFFNETAQAKLKAVSVYIKELLESDKKFLVFAHHQIMLDKLSNTCDLANVRHIRIEGKTRPEMRPKLVKRFQEDSTVRVAVLSITATNTGLTLTSANLVIFAELFWNPGDLVQAEDRAHRIGQQDCVMVQYLVARGTADDYLWPMIQSKMAVLNKVGLSKDDFSNASSTYQKRTGEDSIVKYFNNLKTDDISEDSTDEPKAKRQKT